ncbi:acetylornithine deacetylase [Simiduia curdlanivorans]|uniref:Acetylornithine deacetylase n=1 Tax=Simiduia curdlanivorans TaxID=1492769 RepID=A0ABV8V1H1_9GAMM|nr:acetylornithine deacetylase [Simiduia curdlanivorans]MDN3637786.1 acetylornithine deacetylase [Simiduia curdlanivorans]
MTDLKQYRQALGQLVALPSVSCASPRLDMSNREVVDLLANWFADLGFETQVQALPGQPNKANLIATLGSGTGGLVLAGHTDTVPFDEHSWDQDPFKLTEKQDRLYGLGATDMKGFFPVILAAVKDFTSKPLKAPLTIIATADEETSMAGARALAKQHHHQAHAAVIGEPTGLKPIRMHKGIMMEAVHVRGHSGHSSDPALGNNALEAMNLVMADLLSFRQELQSQYQHPGFAVSVPTLNLGCIHGGDNPNRICGDCELQFDLRSLPGMDNQQLHADLERRLAPLAQRLNVDITLRSLFADVPAFEQAANSQLVLQCEALTGNAAVSAAFATEAPFLQQLGMETVVLGPGSIDQAHQPNEFIPLDQIAPAVTVLQQLIRHYCC